MARIKIADVLSPTVLKRKLIAKIVERYLVETKMVLVPEHFLEPGTVIMVTCQAKKIGSRSIQVHPSTGKIFKIIGLSQSYVDLRGGMVNTEVEMIDGSVARCNSLGEITHGTS